MKDKAPKTSEEIEKAFRESETYKKVLRDVSEYEAYLNESDATDARNFKQSVSEQKSKTVSKNSSYTVSYWRQVLACTRREFWLIWGDKTSLYTKYFIIISNGLIVSSLFYNLPDTTEGAFTLVILAGGDCCTARSLLLLLLLPRWLGKRMVQAVHACMPETIWYVIRPVLRGTS